MVSVRLILNQDEVLEKEYILKRLESLRLNSLLVTEHKQLITIDVESDNKCFLNIIKDIVSSVIIIFYKYKILLDGISYAFQKDYSYYALMGALLSFDREKEAKNIEEALDGTSISIRTEFEFKNSKLKNAWENIILLANKLIAQCQNQEDLFDLIFFVMAIDSTTPPKVTITPMDTGLKIYSDGIELPIANLTENHNQNTIITVVRERPQCVTINNASKLDKDLVEVIKKLGSEDFLS